MKIIKFDCNWCFKPIAYVVPEDEFHLFQDGWNQGMPCHCDACECGEDVLIKWRKPAVSAWYEPIWFGVPTWRSQQESPLCLYSVDV